MRKNKLILIFLLPLLWTLTLRANPYHHSFLKESAAHDVIESLRVNFDGALKSKQGLFYMGNRASDNYYFKLHLVKTKHFPDMGDELAQSFHFKVNCDVAVKVYPRGTGYKKQHNILGTEFLDAEGPYIKIKIPAQANKCNIQYSLGREDFSIIQLIAEENKFPILKELNHLRVECQLPNLNGLSSTQKFFLTNRYTNMTCPQAFDQYQFLERAEDGFNAKVEALLGRKLSSEFIKNENPFADIDFSQAPKLDAIFLASLVYRNDFYGTVMARLLKYHADRGTPIRVLVSDILQLEKDKSFFYKFIAENPNVKLQEYAFVKGPEDPFFAYLHQLHRDMHIKILVTIDTKNPKNNVVITGGRNIHDGFLFENRPDHSEFPSLVQYGEDEGFVHWKDFEFKMVSQELARVIYAKLSTVWFRDVKTLKVDSINKNIVNPQLSAEEALNPAEGIAVRHFMTVPFRDGRRLEDFFVEMVDSAKNSIHFSSPYLRPTAKLSAAFDRAIARGIDVVIQTRIDLSGDTLDWLYTEVNKESINTFKDRLSIYEWLGNSILHSKFMIIDQEMAFVGSVNISRRSFVHDIESGFLIYNKPFAFELEKLFQSYISGSRLVKEDQKIPWLPGIIIKIFENEF